MAQATLSLKAKDRNNSSGEEAGYTPVTRALGRGHSRSWARRPAGVATGAGPSSWGAGWELGRGVGTEAPAHRVMARGGSVANRPQPGRAVAADEGCRRCWTQGTRRPPRPRPRPPRSGTSRHRGGSRAGRQGLGGPGTRSSPAVGSSSEAGPRGARMGSGQPAGLSPAGPSPRSPGSRSAGPGSRWGPRWR